MCYLCRLPRLWKLLAQVPAIQSGNVPVAAQLCQMCCAVLGRAYSTCRAADAAQPAHIGGPAPLHSGASATCQVGLTSAH